MVLYNELFKIPLEHLTFTLRQVHSDVMAGRKNEGLFKASIAAQLSVDPHMILEHSRRKDHAALAAFKFSEAEHEIFVEKTGISICRKI
jgi:hypothetical protein